MRWYQHIAGVTQNKSQKKVNIVGASVSKCQGYTMMELGPIKSSIKTYENENIWPGLGSSTGKTARDHKLSAEEISSGVAPAFDQ